MQLSERLKNLSPAKRALLLKALREESGSAADDQLIPRRQLQTPPPLSFAQQRLWFLDQLQPGSGYYNMPMAARLSGWLDVAALEQSVNEILRRHEALRTAFRMTDSGPVQVIAPAMNIDLPVIDLTGAENREERLRNFIQDEAHRGFDLTAGPLLRGMLLRLGENDHVVLLTMHHIVGDGWSVGVFLREITALYAAFSAGQPSPLPDLPVQYADFACWQREWLQGERLDAQIGYWKTQLSGLEPLHLPSDRERPALPSDRGAVLSSSLPRDLTAALQDLSRKNDCTLFMTLLAAFQVLLHRYSGDDDVRVGTPTANRIRPELESLIGFFANTLVLRTDLSGDPSFSELLSRVRPIVLGAFAHQDVPFEMVVDAVQPERALGQNPLFQVAFALQNAPLPPVELPGLKQVQLDVEIQTARFDISLGMFEDASGLRASWEYSTDLFDQETIDRMAQSFKTLLHGIVEHPESPISRMPLLAPPRRTVGAVYDRALPRAEEKPAPSPFEPVHLLFEKCAAVAPEAPAVVLPARRITYLELNERCNQLAHDLLAQGAASGDTVAVAGNPGLDAVTALLAVLKAGCVYLPLDANDDDGRLQAILAEAKPRLIVGSRSFESRLGPYASSLFDLDHRAAAIARQPKANLPEGSAVTDRAYIDTSSGTLVAVSHAAAASRLKLLQEQFAISASGSVLWWSAPGTESAIWEVLWPLASGGRSVLLPDSNDGDADWFCRFLEECQVSVVFAHAGLLPRFLEAPVVDAVPQFPRLLLCSGEPLRRDLAEAIEARFPRRLFRLYGTPEGGPLITVMPAAEILAQPGPPDQRLSCGRPAGMTVSVRDKHGEPAPDGVWGDLCVQGPALTSGDLLRTGEKGRRRSDGIFEVAGRGGRHAFVGIFRVVLDAVAAALLEDPAVAECVVRGRPTAEHETWLAAYVVCPGALVQQNLRQLLSARLPASVWQRTVIVTVSAIPLTAGGAVDEPALERLEVIDGQLISDWEYRLRSVPGIEEAVIVERETAVRTPPLHISDVLPRETVSEDGNGAASSAPLHIAERRSAGEQGTAPALSHGGPVQVDPTLRVLHDLLRAAASRPAPAGVVCIQPDGSEIFWTYQELLTQAERILGGLREIGLETGARVMLQVGNNQDFLSAFWGCVLGGFVPVPIGLPPSYQQPNSALTRLQASWEMLDRPLIAAGTTAIAAEIRNWAGSAGLNDVRVASLSDLRNSKAGAAWHGSLPEDVALILLTSGSTGLPKGVQLTHRNLIVRSAASKQLNDFSGEEVTLNWLPLDHVGGIVYFHLRDVFLGCRQIHAPTESVLQDALKWLDWIASYRATVTWAPNFAFALVNERAAEVERRQWDLSSMRFISNGGEAVVAKTARRFLQLLGPHGLAPGVMHPAWGMSETSSGVTYSYNFTLDSTSDNDSFVEVGGPIPGVSLRIVDENDEPVAMGEIGRLQVSGSTITPGYYGKEELNQEAFTADGWFRTGDLGFLNGGRLSITGREKDIIIIGGRNFSSYEIESAVDEVEGVEVSYTAACAVRRRGNAADQLAVFFCGAGEDAARQLELIDRVREQVVRSLGVKPDYLIPLQRHQVPKTGIGKIQYARLREDFEKGEFDALLKELDIQAGNANTVPDWFYQRVWRRHESPLRNPRAAPPQTMVFSDRMGLGANLCSEWDRSGFATVRVEAAAEFQRTDAHHYRIDPRNPEHYRRLLDSTASDGLRVTEFLHLWTYEPYAGEAGGIESLNAAQDRGVYSLLFLVQSLAQTRSDGEEQSVRLLVLSSHTQPVLASDRIAVEKSPILGLIRTIPQEMPWLECRHIDLGAASPEQSATLVRRELEVFKGDREAAYRHGRRLVPRVEKVELRGRQAGPPLLEPRAMYLVTGGLGGIGLEIAKHLLHRYQARVLLVGRTPLPARNLWPSHLAKGDDLARRLEAFIVLERLGGKVEYAAVDAGDLSGLRAAVEKCQTAWDTSLRGVIHLAGIFAERLLVDETKETFAAALHAKVAGTWALSQLLKDDLDRLFISFASVNGIFGGATAGAYAAANSFLDSFTRSGNAMRYCFHWSMWDGVGMSREYGQKELSRAKGYHAITAQQGLNSLLIGLSHRKTNLLVGLDGSNRHIKRLVAKETAPATELAACFVPENGEAPLSALEELAVYDRFQTRSRCTFLPIEKMPRTDSGDIDREQLESLIGGRHRAAATQVMPRTEIERRIAAIWEEVLRVPRVGVHDNFFELGGDSILAIQAISRANQAGLHFVPAQLFQHQTIAGLASVCKMSDAAGADQSPVQGEAPLTPIQKWFFELDLPDKHHFNMSLMLKVGPGLDPALMAAAVERILYHHDALRLRYEKNESGWRQWHARPEEPAAVPVFSVVDMSGVPEQQRSAAVEKAAAELQAGLDLAGGPLIRVVHFDFGGLPGRLLFIIHHLVMDGISWRILLQDLLTAYEQLSQGLAVTLPLKTASFQAWSLGLAEYARSETARGSLEHWSSLAGVPVAATPVDHPGGANTIAQLAGVSVWLSAEETQAVLQEVPAVYHTQINDVLLTALAEVFQRWTGRRSLHIDLEGHGREDVLEGIDVSRTVGWFTSMFPVHLELPAGGGLGESLKGIKEQLRRIPDRGLTYGVLRYLSADPEIAARLEAAPQPEVSFNYLGQVNQAGAEHSPLGLEPAEESFGAAFSPLGERRHIIDVIGIVVDGRLRFDWAFSSALHETATIERLAASYVEVLREIVAHCQSPEAGGYTPSDFPLAGLDDDALSQILTQVEFDKE